MPEGITKRRLVPVVLPFGVDTEKKQKVNPKNPEVNPGKDPKTRLKVDENPYVRPIPVRPAPVMPEPQ